MRKKDPKFVVLQFNECINNRDIEGLSSLMAEEHVFIDSSDDNHRGKESDIKGWIIFFNLYPDYENHFSTLESRDNLDSSSVIQPVHMNHWTVLPCGQQR